MSLSLVSYVDKKKSLVSYFFSMCLFVNDLFYFIEINFNYIIILLIKFI